MTSPTKQWYLGPMSSVPPRTTIMPWPQPISHTLAQRCEQGRPPHEWIFTPKCAD